MNSTSNFWSERCVSATQLPLPTLLLKLYASYGSVIAAFCATSILCVWLCIWLRFISPESRKSMWKLLRVFVCLLLLGSLSGIVAWSFRILIRVEDYTAIKVSDKAQAQDIIAQKYRVQGGWFGFYGVQFFCLSLAKLLVLDHFSTLAIKSVAPGKRLCLIALKRAVCCFVILCNAVGLGAYLFAAFSITQLSFDRLALAKLIRNNAPAADISNFAAKNATNMALFISVKMVEKHRLQLVEAADKHNMMSMYLKRRLVATVVVVFFGLSLSVCSAIIFAVANVGYEYNSSIECGGTFPTGQCWPCQPVGQIMKSWLRFTPEFHAVVVLLGSPATLTFAVWGMLSRKDRLVLTNRSNARPDREPSDRVSGSPNPLSG